MNPSDPIGRPKSEGALFSRLFSKGFRKKDTISLLRALIEFSSLKKTLVVYDRNDMYEFLRPRLECLASKNQVYSRCRGLKRLYRSKLSEGVTAGGLTGDDAVIFELSEKLWGEEIMLELKEKERERSAKEVRSRKLRAVLGLEDVRMLKDGSDEGGGDVCAKSEGQSSGMVSGKGGKRKREVLDEGDGEIVGSEKSSRKVSRKQKYKGVEIDKLAEAKDSRTKSGLVDGSP